MDEMDDILALISQQTTTILDVDIPVTEYIPINLSEKNVKLKEFSVSDHVSCQEYIDSVLDYNKSAVAYGGYLEKRNLYSENSAFNEEGNFRNIHLGMDFWAKTGTKVVTPIDGKIHSFQNNANLGNYGPTIILEHETNGGKFFSLYGHLSLESLEGLYIAKEFQKGETLATLGSPEINVGYAPHLHFQLILDLQGKFGDYPGVCSEKVLDFYSKNCPDPNLLLKIQS